MGDENSSPLQEIYENSGSWKTAVSRRSRRKVRSIINAPVSRIPKSIKSRPSINSSIFGRFSTINNSEPITVKAKKRVLSRINEINAREPDIMEEKYVKMVQKALVNFFRDGYITYFAEDTEPTDEEILDFINEMIINAKMVISGGFILKSMGFIKESEASSSIDVDIYLPHNVHASVYDTMSKLFNCDRYNSGKHKDKCILKYFRVGEGSKSAFFRKNKIYSVTKYQRTRPGIAEMDLVRADKTTKPIGIVKRFDLTFCQNWYDGNNVWAQDKPAVLKEDTGYLDAEYVAGYLEGNNVTRKRIGKYMKRGFRVSYIDPVTANIIEITPEALADIW